MTAQIEFRFKPAKRQTVDDKVNQLAAFLEDSPETWVSGKTLARALGMCERTLRGAASASNGRICSWPGSPGYALTKRVEDDDLRHGINALKAQANDMLRRAGELLKGAAA